MWTRSSALFQQFFCITLGCTIAFICGWQMALLMFALLPFLVAAGYIQQSLSMNRHVADTKLMEHASKVVL
jgi:cyanate permease